MILCNIVFISFMNRAVLDRYEGVRSWSRKFIDFQFIFASIALLPFARQVFGDFTFFLRLYLIAVIVVFAQNIIFYWIRCGFGKSFALTQFLRQKTDENKKKSQETHFSWPFLFVESSNFGSNSFWYHRNGSIS